MNISIQYPGKEALVHLKGYKSQGKLSIPFQNGQKDIWLFEGDNRDVLSILNASFPSSFDLIYIDPPFGTGQVFKNIEQQTAYSDELVDEKFLEFLRERLAILHSLLSDKGSIYIHIDKKIGHYVKLIMDEIWGNENFLNDITRIKCNPKNFDRQAFGNCSDMILLYAKCKGQHIWEEQRVPLREEEVQTLFPKVDPKLGPFTTHPLHAPGETLDGDTGQEWKGLKPPKGRHWRYNRKVLDELDEAGMIEWSSTGNPRKKVFAKDHKGKKIQDVWEFKDKGGSYVSYPTEKNQELLKQIILQSSDDESWVLDAFAGSGATLLAANSLGRKAVGIDASAEAIKTIKSNLDTQEIPFAFSQLLSPHS